MKRCKKRDGRATKKEKRKELALVYWTYSSSIEITIGEEEEKKRTRTRGHEEIEKREKETLSKSLHCKSINQLLLFPPMVSRKTLLAINQEVQQYG